jgi:hypothetical protein
LVRAILAKEFASGTGNSAIAIFLRISPRDADKT